MSWQDEDELDETEDSADDALEDTDLQEDPAEIPCPYCKRPILDDAVRCPHCGNYISAETAPHPRRPWWWIVAVILLILLLMRFLVRW